jgi:FkbM family methyltransferase
MAITGRLPDTWFGLRLAMVLRRIVTMRLPYPDGAMDVERWGLRMRLHPRDNGCEKNLLMTPRMYEPTELKALAAEIALARGRARPFIFVDIGANVGLFSLFVAAMAAPHARILAIEPEPGNVARLAFNVGANADLPIKIMPIALSDGDGELAIELDRRDRGGSRTKRIDGTAMAAGTVRIATRTLADVLAGEHIDAVDALKIDVEGFEDVILDPFFRNAAPRLRPGLIIIEDSSASWKVDLLSILTANDYVMVARSKQNLVLRRTTHDAGSRGPVDARDAAMDAQRLAR